MALYINNNTAAYNSYRNLSATQGQMSKSLEKLSSGFRINRAADDAAGLAISEGLRSQVGGLKQAVRNAQDGISVVQTAEGALSEVHSILQRMRDLAVQASNDSNSAEARNNITNEVDSLSQELSRIADSTNFNGTKLLDGTTTNLNFQVGAGNNVDSRIQVDLTAANVSNVHSALTVGSGAESAVADVLTPTDVTGDAEFTFGSTTVTVAMGAAGTHLTAQSVADTLNDDANFSALGHASINANNQLVVSAHAAGVDVVGGATSGTHGAAGTGIGTSADGAAGAVNFSNHINSQAAITVIDAQIKNVSTARSNLGAYQNRFEHTINNLNVSVENLSASESRIRDADMAAEMVQFQRHQVLNQAGTAMLAQANQLPQGILQLLR